MPLFNRARGPRIALPVVVLVAGGLMLVAVTRDDGPAAGTELGPTVAAQPRDLTTTLEASGALRRASEHTIAYAAPSASASAEGGEGTSPGEGGEGASEVPSATLTSLVGVGTTADRGTVLYTADQQPVVALLGDVPAWRTLEQGVAAGADVRQLEENLVALGYGATLTVDQSFTANTAAAVQAWETALGRTTPDGIVTVGDVVFLATPGDVVGHEAAVGDTIEVGSPLLAVGSEQRVVVATVDATEAGGWTAGDTVEVEWADSTTVEGTVLGTGTTVTSGQVELTVALAAGDAGAGSRRRGATATVTLVDARRDDVIAVPVAAIVGVDGHPAVRVPQPTGPDEIVPVQTGLVAAGWIEITTGLDANDVVRLPA